MRVHVDGTQVTGDFQSEAEDALEGENLDHLAKTAAPTNLQTNVDDDSILGYALASSAVSDYDRTTDSLEAIGAVVSALPDSGALSTIDGNIDTLVARTSNGGVARKTVEFDGGAGNGAIGTVALFTVTGCVRARVSAYCTEDLVGAATHEVGVSGDTATLIAQTADATDIDNLEAVAATPAAVVADATPKIIGGGQDIIATVGSAAITDGTITYVCEYDALSSDGAVVAA